MNPRIQQLQSPVDAWHIPMVESMVDGQTRKATPAEIRRAVTQGRPVPLKLVKEVKNKKPLRQIDTTEATK